LTQPAQGLTEESDPVILTIRDFQGQLIKLTARQWEHIVREHDSIERMQWAVRETLESPQEVRKSRKAPDTGRLYYRRYTGTEKGDKWVCVVVKFLENDAFISTAY
jgi:hypothetical protein